MVTDKAGYKFVTGLDKIRIDGGIMPNRSDDPAAPVMSRKDAIRGEDIAFAAEAVNEVSRVLGIGGAQTCDMTDTRLLGWRIKQIAEAVRSQTGRPNELVTTDAVAAIKRGVAWSTRDSDLDWSFSGHLGSVFYDIANPVTFDVNPDDFIPGNPARLHSIKTLLSDTQKVRAGVSLSIPLGSLIGSNLSWINSSEGEDPGGGQNAYYYISRTGGGAWYWRSGTHRTVVSGGAFVGTIGDYDGIDYSYRAYAAIWVSEDHYEGEDHSRKQFIDVVPVNCSIGGGRITIPAAQIGSIARAAVSAHGITERGYVPGEQGGTTEYQIIKADMIDLAVQRIRGSHTIY